MSSGRYFVVDPNDNEIFQVNMEEWLGERTAVSASIQTPVTPVQLPGAPALPALTIGNLVIVNGTHLQFQASGFLANQRYSVQFDVEPSEGGPSHNFGVTFVCRDS